MSNNVAEPSTIYYGPGGTECEAIDALAKVVNTKNGNTNYYASCGKNGLNNIYNHNPHDHNKTKWTLCRVNEESFKLYLKFLKTRREIYINNANWALN